MQYLSSALCTSHNRWLSEEKIPSLLKMSVTQNSKMSCLKAGMSTDLKRYKTILQRLSFCSVTLNISNPDAAQSGIYD